MTLIEKLQGLLDSQVYVATTSEVYTGILVNVSENVIAVRSIFPGYGDITDHFIFIEQIAYVRLIQ